MAAIPSLNLARFVERIPPRRRIILGALLATLVLSGYWVVLLKPAWEEQNRARAELLRLEPEAERTRRMAAQRPALEQEIKLLEARLFRAVQQLPAEKEIPSLLTRLAALGREIGLEVSSFRPGNPVVRDFYTEVPVQLKVVGSYNTLGILFERLARLDRIVNVADMTIRPADKGQRSGASIQAEFGVITYTYTGIRRPSGDEPLKTST
jgi:type IV pilus assembly protein PilO